MRQIQAVLFDFDGTLVSSIDMYVDIFMECLREQGVTPDSREATKKFAFEPLEKIFATLGNFLDVEKFRASFLERELALNHTEHLPLVEEVPGLLDFLRSRQIKTGIVSSKLRQPIEHLLAEYDLARHFDVVLGRDDTELLKPNPEPVLKACAELAVPPSAVIFVGDSLIDLTAAREAGAIFVGVLTGACAESDFTKNKADYVFRHVGEIAQLITE